MINYKLMVNCYASITYFLMKTDTESRRTMFVLFDIGQDGDLNDTFIFTSDFSKLHLQK